MARISPRLSKQGFFPHIREIVGVSGHFITIKAEIFFVV